LLRGREKSRSFAFAQDDNSSFSFHLFWPTAGPWAREKTGKRWTLWTERKHLALLVCLALTAALALLAPSGLRGDTLKISLDDTINPITEEYVARAIAEAERTHADALLIELSTPGGLADSTRQIMERMLASRVPIIVYVTPSGSRAASAGFFILEAADVAAMATGTNTGAAHPVALGGGQMDPVMKEKIENDSAALMRSVVSKRGRNVEIAESAVRQSKSFTDAEALKEHLIDLIAKDQQDLFKQLDGRSIKRFDGTEVSLRLAGKPVREFPMTLKQRILGYLMDPNIAFIVLAIGLLALYVEFNHPGAVAPGVVGLIFVILAVFAFNLLPTRFAGLALIVAAFVLFALEAKFTAHGVLAVGGVASMIMGALLLVDAPIPEMRVHLITAVAVTLPIAAITVFLLSIVIRARQNKVVTGSQGMVGAIAVARTPLVPEGKVFVHGELWNAVASAEVAAGEEVCIRQVDGLVLRVDPAGSLPRSSSAIAR
jgi:membrane-bound serine protease (ClpP class)